MRRALAAAPYLAAGLVCLLLAVVAYLTVLRQQIDEQVQAAARRLEFFTQSLEAQLDRNEALPKLLRLDPRVAAVLDDPDATQDDANRHLAAVAREAGVSAVYLVDAEGLTIAASNWDQPVSFLGQNYGFRPYVVDALAGHTGRFYGIGATSGEPAYFVGPAKRPEAAWTLSW